MYIQVLTSQVGIPVYIPVVYLSGGYPRCITVVYLSGGYPRGVYTGVPLRWVSPWCICPSPAVGRALEGPSSRKTLGHLWVRFNVINVRKVALRRPCG